MRNARRYLRFWGPDPKADVDDELAFHMDMRVAAYVRAGMSEADARVRVAREAGDMEAARQACLAIDERELRRIGMREAVESFAHDLRVAARSLRRSPAYCAGVVATLALGIGATTAIFSVVHGVLLRPLPYPNAGRVVQLWQVNERGGQTQFSDPNFADVQERLRSFESVAQFTQALDVSVSGLAEGSFRARTSIVSADFFRTLGVRPIRGRTFLPDELVPGGAPAAVVTERFWRVQLGARDDVLGLRLAIGPATYTVVGVMEAALDVPASVGIYLAKELSPPSPYRTGHNWRVLGRLRDGETHTRAQAELSRLARELKQQYGDETRMTDVQLVPLREEIVGDTRKVLLMLLASSAVLLLIACANVVNLLLARATARRGEIAVRLALGAGRGRLLGQFLAESTVVAAVGGILGVVLAAVGVRALLRLEPGDLPRVGDIGLHLPVLLFALGTIVLVALLLGVIGAVRGARGALREVIAEGQRTMAGPGSARRVRDALVVVQVALAVMLLVGASLLGRSFLALFDLDPGYRTDNLLVMDVTVSGSDSASLVQRTHFYDALLARAVALPGVQSAGAVNALPLTDGGRSNGTFLILRSPDEQLALEDYAALARDPTRAGESEFRAVGGDYFETMGIPLLRGRLFEGQDAPEASSHLAVISESLARQRWPNEDPIGTWIQFGGIDGNLTPFMIVGVVGDVRDENLEAVPEPTFYASYRQRPRVATRMNLVFRSEGDVGALASALRGIAHDIRPEVPPRFRTMETVRRQSLAARRFVLVLIGVFGTAALLLATLGVYSVISYLVAQRQREIGVRMALGAQPGGVRGMIVRQGVVLAGIGIVLGAGASIASGRLIAGMLYGVVSTDAVSLVTVAMVLVAVAAAASWLPARRAASIAPADVLRS